ncbi:MAG: hypothetical protein NVSMB14_04100 [Isosphaeraceae bacterium]
MVWLLGLMVAGLGAIFSDEGREPLVVIVELSVFALFGEIVSQVVRLRRPETISRPIPLNAKPPDGAIGTAKLRGVRGEANSVDATFQKFVSIDQETTPAPRETRELPALWGRAAIVSLFVGRDGKRWSDKEIAEAHKSIERAGLWIEREASRWNAPVNIEVAETYFETMEEKDEDVEIGFVSEPDGVAPLERHAGTKALVEFSRAAARLGFVDAGDLTTKIEARIDADVCVWLLHERRGGRSFALPKDESSLPGVALAVCYAREANFPEPLKRAPFADPITFVHEIFHLFGATDKYGVSLSEYPPKSVTSRDVMRLDYESLDRLRVDRLTAAEIGWVDFKN